MRLGFRALVVPLEYPPDSREGIYTQLHTPAVAQWLRIARKGLEELCEAETEVYHAGDLWKASGGSDVCNSARMEFWKARMREEGYPEF
jgi:hypothetical protein